MRLRWSFIRYAPFYVYIVSVFDNVYITESRIPTFSRQNDDAPVSLMEMRFHIPPSELAGAADPVESFHSHVMKQASVISVSGDAIAIFREIHILTPRLVLRVRYDFDLFESVILYDFPFFSQRKIRYKNIPHVFPTAR